MLASFPGVGKPEKEAKQMLASFPGVGKPEKEAKQMLFDLPPLKFQCILYTV